MSLRTSRAPAFLLSLAFAFAIASPVFAEDSLDAARQLYAAAAYDDALAMLNRLHSTSDTATPELDQERALCFLALNRVNDAEQAITSVVQANPLYLPDASTVAPRVRAAFQDVRARLLPDLARAAFARARANFTQKEYAKALADLDVVLTLTRDVPDAVRDKDGLEDIRLLAEGFKTLTEAALVPAPAPPATPTPPEEGASVERIFDATVPGVEPPAIIKQDVPQWRPSMGTPPAIPGLLSVLIDERGMIERADMVRPLNPTYDSLLLAATQKWSYAPATHNGVKVKFRKIIRLELK
jgi:tetratricopeptide (TPR) repeat protein